MSDVIFETEVDCPMCEFREWHEVKFGEEVFAPDGGFGSSWNSARCSDCNKTFWFNATIRIEIDVEMASEKKPQGVL